MKEVIAFDIGGTHMRAAVVRGKKISGFTQIETPKDRNLFLGKIEELILKLDSKKIKGIGIGIASPINKGVIKNAPNLPLKNFDLKKHLEKKFKKKVEIKNDAGCFALAESVYGLKLKNFILITVGTGIGGGIVIKGKEYRGGGYGAEFGHMRIRGKEWETLWKETREKIKNKFGEQKLLKDLVKNKDSVSKNFLDEAADYLGEGIASLVSAFDPEAVLIGGGIKEAGSPFLKLIIEKTKKYSFLPRKTPIYWTTLKHSGILGSSLLVSN